MNYNSTIFSSHHNKMTNSIIDTQNYLLSLDNLNYDDVLDILKKMMRCNDNNLWCKTIFPIIIDKYNDNKSLLNVFSIATLERSLENVR